jgi:two-component system, chemotaxis family, protein-glutamate methylesterase/glutaminase
MATAISIKAIKVLIVDDSAIARKVFSEAISQDSSIEVVGTALDAYIAREKIVQLEPDVLTLDVEMPRMDGITFLQKLMKSKPMPVIILSSLTPRGGKNAIAALEAGAFDVMCKPDATYGVSEVCTELIEKIKYASRAKIKRQPEQTVDTKQQLPMAKTTNKIFAIGASTGGVQALTEVISAFPANAPGTLIVQHMPEKFTASFAERLNGVCAVNVKEARDGDSVIPGSVLLAPGGFHMLLNRRGENYYVSIKDGPAVCRQRPSVEVMFNSVAKYAGPNAIGAILTGMGHDGAKALLNMRQLGGHTVVQNEETCVVYGMPREAINLEAAEKIVPLKKVAAAMINFAQFS